VSDAYFRAVNPHGGHRRTHALLFRMFFRRFEDAPVGQVDGTRKTSRSAAQARLLLTVKWSGWILLRVYAMLHYGLYRESACDFTMRFAAHAIGEHIKV
jgi:hypothetical protein